MFVRVPVAPVFVFVQLGHKKSKDLILLRHQELPVSRHNNPNSQYNRRLLSPLLPDASETVYALNDSRLGEKDIHDSRPTPRAILVFVVR